MKRYFGKFTAMIMVAIIAFGIFSVPASGIFSTLVLADEGDGLPVVTNIQWDGYMVKWENPEVEFSHIIVYLLKDDYQRSSTTIHEGSSVDFTSEITEHGNGSYSVNIQVVYENEDGGMIYGQYIASPELVVDEFPEKEKHYIYTSNCNAYIGGNVVTQASEDTYVTIVADSPANKDFKLWVSDQIDFGNGYNFYTTSFLMPDEDVYIRAIMADRFGEDLDVSSKAENDKIFTWNVLNDASIYYVWVMKNGSQVGAAQGTVDNEIDISSIVDTYESGIYYIQVVARDAYGNEIAADSSYVRRILSDYQYPNVRDLTWDGKTAVWTLPDKEYKSLTLNLYKDEQNVFSINGDLDWSSNDFTELIESSGAGNYYFEMQLSYEDEDGNIIWTNTVYSPKKMICSEDYVFPEDVKVYANDQDVTNEIVEVNILDSITLVPVFTPENVSNKKVNWSVYSENGKINIADNGVVTVSGYDTAKISFRADGGRVVECTVQARFVDVRKNGSTYSENVTAGGYKAVYWAADKGITRGYSADGTFRPQANIKRSEMVMMLWRLAGAPEPDMNNIPKFTDISKLSGNVKKAVYWAFQTGITKGYNDGTFKPDDEVKRQEIAIFLFRMARMQGREDENLVEATSFNDDADISSKGARSSIYWAVEEGIIKGFSDPKGYFKPLEHCSRQQMAIMLMRYSKEN